MHRRHILPIYLLVLLYILGSSNGFVALWKTGNPEPISIFPYPVSALPSDDQKALSNGITIDGSRSLSQLLEDYLS